MPMSYVLPTDYRKKYAHILTYRCIVKMVYYFYYVLETYNSKIFRNKWILSIRNNEFSSINKSPCIYF